jgi:hypothetical protein
MSAPTPTLPPGKNPKQNSWGRRVMACSQRLTAAAEVSSSLVQNEQHLTVFVFHATVMS